MSRPILAAQADAHALRVAVFAERALAVQRAGEDWLPGSAAAAEAVLFFADLRAAVAAALEGVLS